MLKLKNQGLKGVLAIGCALGVNAVAAQSNNFQLRPDMVPCDNSRYECDKKTLVEKNRVIHVLSQTFDDQEIFSVPGRPIAIVTVRETVTQPGSRPVDVVVTPRAKSAEWQYIQK